MLMTSGSKMFVQKGLVRRVCGALSEIIKIGLSTVKTVIKRNQQDLCELMNS